MTQQHPITPPPELVAQWTEKAEHWEGSYEIDIATQAAQWGADQELEVCCEWLANARNHTLSWNEATNYSANLRAARRPKPPSLKEQAYIAVDRIERSGYPTDDLYIIRRALEQLND